MDDVKKTKKVVKAANVKKIKKFLFTKKPRIVKQDVNTHFLFELLVLMTGLNFRDKNIENTLTSLMDYIDSKLNFGDSDIDDCYIAFELK